ncbi:hypothetical protein BV20DRAFT_932760 [Pilatotrama ljubarskyi]|nr:hypothetical protein BV20DRAFT_932760 [Pilatotrama ljubarskyi]
MFCNSVQVSRLSLIQIFSLLLSARLAAGVRTIVTDDKYGDEATGALPVYSPTTAWTQGQPCSFDDSECLVDVDPSMAQNGTWHDSVGKTDDAPPRSIDLSFEGNSIVVYCIISEVDRIEIAVSNMTFELDGQHAGQFYHDVSGQTDAIGNYEIHYNISVFNASVPQGKHALRINSVGYSRILFDYALYTTDSDFATTTGSASPAASSASGQGAAAKTSIGNTTSSNSHVSLGVVIGAVAAVAVALLAIGILVSILIRRRRRTQADRPDHINSAPKRDRRFYGKDDIDAPSYASSVASLPVGQPETTNLSYTHSNSSRYHEDLERSSRDTSPSGSSVPLMEFSTPSSTASQQDCPRIVVVGTETRMEGPDNSMARIARRKVAEREAELTRRVREVENALAAKYPAIGSSRERGTASPSSPSRTSPSIFATSVRTESVRLTGGPSGSSQSEVVLRTQLMELRTEMARMRTVQQQMALELRDATEPPPEYQ